MRPQISSFFKHFSKDVTSINRLLVTSYIHINEIKVNNNLFIKKYIIEESEGREYQSFVSFVKLLSKLDPEYNIENLIEKYIPGSEWYEKYKNVLNERIRDKRIKRYTLPYMRPRLRSAYLSLKRNMPLLWTFYDHPETGLPNTNNALEGVFSDIKGKIRVHLRR